MVDRRGNAVHPLLLSGMGGLHGPAIFVYAIVVGRLGRRPTGVATAKAKPRRVV